LTNLKPILEKNVVEQEKLQKKLDKDRVEANKKKAVVEGEAAVVNKRAGEIKILQNEAQAALDTAIPALKAAQNAVNTLNQGDIAELKQTKEATPLVLMTFTGVAILLEERSDYKKVKWDDCKKMLAKSFFERLKSFDKEKIKEKVIKALDKFVGENPNFVPEEIEKASKAGKSLCLWARAILNYNKINKEIEPKKAHLKIMNDEFNKANGAL
jgi:dynein heavy chain